MLNRKIGLAGPDPENAAPKPATSEARVERQCTIDKRDHRVDVLAEIRQHLGGIGEGARVVLRDLERLPRKISGRAMAGLRVVGPAVIDQPHVTDRRPGEGRPVTPIDRDRAIEQAERLGNPLSRYWIEG